mmetsp:Transcript_12832/g.11639  ORF Transcript_12832/g.11639 Transcript_12832/m.11639 type:complete len:165 (+) Transcript_12832:12-506(+)
MNVIAVIFDENKNQYKLTTDGKKYIKTIKNKNLSLDDPTLCICYNTNIINKLLYIATGNILDDLPPIPAYISLDSPELFMESINERVRQYAGGRYKNIIGPNTLTQFINVQLALRDIEYEPFIQRLRQYIGEPFGSCCQITDRNSSPVACNRHQPNHPYLLVFN